MHAGDSPRARRHPAQYTRNGFGHREATLTIWQCHICYVGNHRERTPLTDINNIEIMRVDLTGISVTSVYKPPGEQFRCYHPQTTPGHQPQVIIRYFNSHTSQWGYATMNAGGELVEDWADLETYSRSPNPQLLT